VREAWPVTPRRRSSLAAEFQERSEEDLSRLRVGYVLRKPQVKLSMVFIPASIYLFMALTMEYPKTERVTSNVPTSQMWKQLGQPLFHYL
jgi:hypothetical protein